jgi:hypothetical protein
MADQPSSRPDDREPDVADASWLLKGAPPEAQSDQMAAGSAPTDEGAYDLASPESEAAPEVVPPVAPIPQARPRPEPSPRLEPSAEVEQTWSRAAEWGPTIAMLAFMGFGFAVLVYFLIAQELFGPGVIVMMAAGVVLALASYPIMITLERPVRVTPEQAVNDFYGALSHHVPHYRRMWLLLGTAGRTSSSFATYEGFARYWKGRLAQLRGDRASALTPLRFEVLEFSSDKSAGASRVSAKFRVEVSIRGRTGDGPIASIPVKTVLVRGPDRMWYLTEGTLAEAP